MLVKYNSILATFDSLVDLDYGIWNFLNHKCKSADYINKDIVNINNDEIIRFILMNRKEANPLSILVKDNSDKALDGLLGDKQVYDMILNTYSRPYDILRLLMTYIEYATSLDISIVCRDSIEQDYIYKFSNNKLQTFLSSDYKDINLSDYTVILIKYFSDIYKFKMPIENKHIWLPKMRCNMTIDDKDIASDNSIEFIDLYKDVKWVDVNDEELQKIIERGQE